MKSPSKARLAGLLALLAIVMGAIPLPAEVSESFITSHHARLDRLFAHLDPSHEAVGPIRHQWDSGQRLQAAAALAAYFNTKAFPVEDLEPVVYPGTLEEHARKALEDRFYLLDEWEPVPRLPDNGLDWQHRGRDNDKERAWMLNRHGIFPYLAEAYRRTGEDRYREGLNRLWQDWVIHNPYPDRLTFSAPWRALEVARRILNSWVHVFYGPPVLSDETRLLVLASIVDHGDALRQHASFWGGNHLISEKLALLTLASAWPELADAPEWQRYAVDRVSRQIMAQSYPDGSYKELSNHYQRVVLVNAQYFIRLVARIDPDFRELPVIRRIEQMWTFFAEAMKPDGTGPLSNASDLEPNADYIHDVWASYARTDWLYIATNGLDGEMPEGSASRFFPWAGQAFLRNNWKVNGDWVYFDAGPYGTAHQHVDRLHVSASLRGRPTLVDNGRYTYRPGPWLDYFKGPEGHNLIMLDGQAADPGPREVKSPLPVTFDDRPGVSMAAATAFFKKPGLLGLPGLEKPVPWTRAVVLDKRGYLLIIDHVVTFSEHDLTARWHFHPDISEEAAISSLQVVSASPLPITLSTARGVAAPDVAGFYSPDYNEKLPAPELRFATRIFRPTTILWILRPPGSPQLSTKVLSEPGAPVFDLWVKQADRPFAHLRLRLHPNPELLEYTVSSGDAQ